MKHNLQTKSWWGAPKKFTTEKEERKVSWLELFYDLVYVIAISTITHYVAAHFSINALLDYFYLFVIIFWGWLNGSLYHDLHGSEGLRTKLMTLWQMAIVAALVINLHSDPEHLLFNVTVVLLIMQFYITYLWWSVGIYDKEHRKLNKPYTMLYLLSFALILATLFVEQPYARIMFYITLVLNYLPPFISHNLLIKQSSQLNLSPSMTERLGLFTIIIFGEVVLGVTNGLIEMHHLSAMAWVEFVLAIAIVFALWWLFFTLISDRQCKAGLVNSSLFELLFIPTLMGLGLLGASFSSLFKHFIEPSEHTAWVTHCFGFSISLFLLGIWAMLYFLEEPDYMKSFKKNARQIILATTILMFAFTCIPLQIGLVLYLSIALIILVALILCLNSIWYKIVKIRENNEGEF
ncbi:MAG: hypothetical protein GC192_01090 [Bacteroidetes bacterium]|nr:hypothetical protein [Bacteroidota bacterium]